MRKFLITIPLILFTCFASASKVSEFEIRGFKAGDDVESVCENLKEDFDETHLLKKKYPQYNFSSVDHARTNRVSSLETICDGGFTAYDKELGYMAWSDSIEIKSTNGVIFWARNQQTIVGGDTMEDCLAQADTIMGSMVDKYGEPTSKDEQQGKRPLKSYNWNYSEKVFVRTGDKENEQFSVATQCSMYESRATFAQLKILTEFHSGEVLTNARKSVSSSVAPKL